MSFGANALVPSWRAPVLPARGVPAWHPATTLPVRSVPGWHPATALPVRQPNYAAAAFQQQQEMRRQEELRRMHERAGRPAPIVNNYYSQPAPAPLTVVPPPVATVAPPPPIYVPPSMPEPQPDVSPGNATQDLSPAQDAAAAASPAAQAVDAHGEEHPGHSIGRKVIIGLVVVGLGVGGYMFMKHKKSGGGGHASKHGMQGFRRRRRR